MVLEPLRDLLGVLRVTLDPKAERLDALDQREGAVGGERRARVAQKLDADLDHVGDRVAEDGGVARAVVARVGLGEARELVDVLRPGELSAVDDDTRDDRSVSAQELGRRVNDDVCAELEGADEVRRRDRVVDDERHAVLVRDTRDLRDVEDVDLGVADRLRRRTAWCSGGRPQRHSSASSWFSTNVTSMPSFASVYLNRLYVPP